MKQTAVEWLVKNCHIVPKNELNKRELINQAKEMEKQQIINAYLDGNYDNKNGRCEEEKYYKEIFNK